MVQLENLMKAQRLLLLIVTVQGDRLEQRLKSEGVRYIIILAAYNTNNHKIIS